MLLRPMERRPYTPEDAALPEPLTVNVDRIPHRLQEYDHFVVWHYERVAEELKKPPCDPKTGKRASVRKPETWGSFQEARHAYESGQFAGVGIVLTAAMGIVGIDIDHCIVDGQLDEEAHRIITAIASYAEVSPSGTGVRIMLEGKLPGAFRRRGTLEMYEDMRYLTLTGQWIANTPLDIQPRHQEVSDLYHHIFPSDARETERENTVGDVEQRPSYAYHTSRSDEAVLQKALTAKNGATFARYYHGDTSLWEGAGAE
jgi:putative DNA primase/helicase